MGKHDLHQAFHQTNSNDRMGLGLVAVRSAVWLLATSFGHQIVLVDVTRSLFAMQLGRASCSDYKLHSLRLRWLQLALSALLQSVVEGLLRVEHGFGPQRSGHSSPCIVFLR